MREAIRRGLRFTRHFLRCLLYGYIRPDTLDDYKPRTYTIRIAHWDESEYGLDDVIGGVSALDVQDQEEGYDECLDLGQKRIGSVLTSAGREQVGEVEKRIRLEEREFAGRMMEWYQKQKESLEVDGMELD